MSRVVTFWQLWRTNNERDLFATVADMSQVVAKMSLLPIGHTVADLSL